MEKTKKIQNAKGIGLIEIMVAITISLFLVGGIIELFVNNKSTYRIQQELARMQENARFAMSILTKDIRMAGYSGCSPNTYDHLNPAGNGYSNALYNIKAAVGGWEYSGTAPGQTFNMPSTLTSASSTLSNWNDDGSNALPSDFTSVGKIIPGSDVIVTKKLTQSSNIAVSGGNITSAQIGTVGASGIAQYQVVMITEDCQTADIFQNLSNANSSNVSRGVGSSTNPGPGNKNPTTLFPGTNKWSKAYGPGASILYYDSIAYYIGEGSSGEPALFRGIYSTGPTGSHQELVEGIENMQVLYGEDTDATPDGVANRYVTMNNVSNIQNIVSVRISLLIRSAEEHTLDPDTATYELAGYSSNKSNCTGANTCVSIVINPQDDKRLRIVATTTVKLRNRGTNL